MTRAVWHAMNVTEVIAGLETDQHRGLSQAQVDQRLQKHGYNELTHEGGISPLEIFIGQFKSTLIVILLIAIALSALVGELVDALIIAVIVVFSAGLGFIQEYRAERALEALKKMLSPTITVLRGSKEEEIQSRELVPGDILLLEAGDRIPADARLLESHSVQCDEASLTGESLPVDKSTAPLAEDVGISDQRDMLFAGTTVTYGRGKAAVTSTGMTTELGKIAQEVTTIEKEQTPLERRTEEIGKWLGILALSICAFVAVFSILRELVAGIVDIPFFIEIIMFAIALAVAAVPEALAAIVTGALAIGMRQMAQRNALVRKMPAVETLGCTTVICSDKTGTLTKGEMTIRQILVDGCSVEVTGVGYQPTGEFRAKGFVPETSAAFQKLMQAWVLCNDASLEETNGEYSVRGDPTEGALIVTAEKANLHPTEMRMDNGRVEEIPFSSERKRMTTIHDMADGSRVAFMKGAPESVLGRCSHILENGAVRELDAAKKGQLQEIADEMASNALRVLGAAYRVLSEDVHLTENAVESEMVFLGLGGMIDPPRDEAVEAIRVCKQVQIKPVLITGDHKLTAVAIAKEMGIYHDGDRVFTGQDLEKISDDELEQVVDKVTVYARVSPMDKLKIVTAWRARGEVVAMTGDGVNDAPALKYAAIGVAMGIKGTDVAKEAADMVLSDDNFATIVKAIELGRSIYDNIKKYLTYLMQCNITEVAVIGGVVMLMGPEFLPLLPAAILYINLATDGLPALALGISPPDPDIMQRPPRNPKASIFGLDVTSFLVPAVLIETPFFLFLFFNEFKNITHARTEIFFLFIVVEFVIALNCRSLVYSIFTARPHKWLVAALTWELALIAVLVQIPIVREAFGIQMPSLTDLAVIAGFGAVVFAIIEVTKAVLRRRMLTESARAG